MYIKKLTLQNVKSFRGETVLELGSGVNFLVGDNNGGKSTVLEALLFLSEGPTATKWRPETFYSTDKDGPTSVTVDIAGGVDALVEQSKFSQLKGFVFEVDGENVLRLQRSDEERTVSQNGKDKNVDVKAVCFWHPEREQFENVTGIDARVKSIFDFEAIWADAQPGDHLDFASTKTLGRLLDAAFKRFSTTEHWTSLVEAHRKVFAAEGEDSFLGETNRLATAMNELVQTQYGHAEMRFEFGLPEPSVFMKQGQLHVDDGAGETPVEGKGSGMQRAIALGIIQLYARSEAPADTENPTPLVLMLDEPETWLHPRAQLRLGDALGAIGEREQVFIITHSPYLIRKFDSSRHRLAVFSGQGEQRQIDTSTGFGLFGVGEPTWGEINYRAFGICSHDFHNELYGFVQEHLDAKKHEGRNASEKELDDFLVKEGITQGKEWVRREGLAYPTTLPVYVRNFIHHPENRLNADVTPAELENSTGQLVELVERLGARG